MDNNSTDQKETYPAIEAGGLPAKILFSFRPAVLCLFALLTVFFAWQAVQIQPDASFDKLIPQQHPFIKNMNRHKKDLAASGASIKVSVEAIEGDIYTEEFLQTVSDIADEIFYIDGVNKNGMLNLWSPNVRWTQVTEEGFEAGSVIPPEYDGSEDSLKKVRTNVVRAGEVGRLVADDYKSTVIEVPIYDKLPTTGEPLDYKKFSQDLEETVRTKFENDNIKIHIIGFPKVVGDLLEGLGAIALFGVVTLFITFCLLLFYTRSLRGTFVPLLCSIMAVIWQLGLLNLLGYGLNVYSVLVPFLVLAIGVSHGVQIVNGIALEMADNPDKLRASRLAFSGLYVAGLTALISDGIGFITLLIINIQAIRDLGVAASIGVAAIIFTNLFLLPVLMSYVGIKERGVAHLKVDYNKRSKLWEMVSLCATPKVATVSIVLAVLGYAVGIIGGQQMKIGDLDPGAPELRADSRYNLDNDFITSNYAVSTDVLVTMIETPAEQCATYNTVAALDRFGWAMQNVPGVQSVTSLADVVKRSYMGQNEGNPRWGVVSRDQAAIDSSMKFVPESLMNRECSLALSVLSLDDHKAETLQRVVEAVQTFAADNDTDTMKFKLAAGNAGIEAATNEEIAVAQTQILVLVYAVVAALVFLSFRSIVAVICIIIPLGLTSALCQALMAQLGIGIKVATLPVVALGVGVGVDYGIYIYNRLVGYLSEGLPMREAYYRALATTGRAVAFTGITLGVGVITWIMSPIKFQADMGQLLTFMFLWNMVGALWLLPALAYFLIKPDKHKLKKDSENDASTRTTATS